MVGPSTCHRPSDRRPADRDRDRRHRLHPAQQAQHVPDHHELPGRDAIHEHDRDRRARAHPGHRRRRDRSLVRLYVRTGLHPHRRGLDRMGLADLPGDPGRPGCCHHPRLHQCLPGDGGQDPIVHRDSRDRSVGLWHDPARIEHRHAESGVPAAGQGRPRAARSSCFSDSPIRTFHSVCRCKPSG